MIQNYSYTPENSYQSTHPQIKTDYSYQAKKIHSPVRLEIYKRLKQQKSNGYWSMSTSFEMVRFKPIAIINTQNYDKNLQRIGSNLCSSNNSLSRTRLSGWRLRRKWRLWRYASVLYRSDILFIRRQLCFIRSGYEQSAHYR